MVPPPPASSRGSHAPNIPTATTPPSHRRMPIILSPAVPALSHTPRPNTTGRAGQDVNALGGIHARPCPGARTGVQRLRRFSSLRQTLQGPSDLRSMSCGDCGKNITQRESSQ
ncbi:hypothetical protein ASNO1_37950 [Corallococcus caeni]|uniref:Uncharacterized protein n=1 Tax=Corallococcus caeni TaxID=3082388 RepID=A0ABQ6QU38_9BACT|nr:hypothetical protein ASNO1_37950 [Corallococcus sp. NO1]